MSSPNVHSLLLAAAIAAASADVASAQEDARARAALPEFQIIPAAKPNELTRAAALDPEPFGRWTRSHGDDTAPRGHDADRGSEVLTFAGRPPDPHLTLSAWLVVSNRVDLE